jgi:hypothetical protein
MPTYDYHCPVNDKIVEVKHRISESVNSWGELCQLAGIEVGDTPADAPVEKLITGGGILKSNSMGSEPPCVSGPCCGGGGCGHNH